MSRPRGPGRPGGAGVAFPRGQDGGRNEPAVNPLASSGSAVQLPVIRAREQNGKANGTASRLGITAGVGTSPPEGLECGHKKMTTRAATRKLRAQAARTRRRPTQSSAPRLTTRAVGTKPTRFAAGPVPGGRGRRRPVPSQLPHDGEETSQSGDGDGKETRDSKAVGALHGGGAPFQGRCPPPLVRSWHPPARPGTLHPHFLGREEEPPWGQLDLLASPPAPEEF